MKLLIATRADDNIKWMTDFTHPMIKRYAERCNAEFTILSGNTYQRNYNGAVHNHYRILDLYNLLNKYDRILSLDSDILIQKTCPNIFDEVPEEKIGTIYEDKGSREKFRRSLITSIQEKRGDIGWTEGYINTGVFIVSKCHKSIFKVDLDNLWLDFGQDDVELGYQINKLKFPIHELPFQYNHMSMFSEVFNNYASRFDSYIVHYAGNGHSSIIPKQEHMIQDYYLLKRYGKLI